MAKEPNSPPPEWTVGSLLRWTTDYFKKAGIESPRMAAEMLLAHTLGCERIDLYLRFDQPLSGAERDRFRTLVRRRLRREPVAYITGQREFWSLPLAVDPSVLIPRPDSECLVEACLALLPAAGATWRVLDLGTGSGALILSLASERPGHRFTATDRSFSAVRTAKANAVRLGLSGAVHFLVADWLSPFAPVAKWDLVLSNPPYIPRPVLDTLEPEVSRFEPHLALDGGEDGLVHLDRLIRKAPDYLAGGGWLVLEIGFDQRLAVERIAEAASAYDQVVFGQDYGGRDRWVRLHRR